MVLLYPCREGLYRERPKFCKKAPCREDRALCAQIQRLFSLGSTRFSSTAMMVATTTGDLPKIMVTLSGN